MEVVGKYAKKHYSTRWLSLKFLAVRLLEQWENLIEYFFKFLPKQNDFKGTIKETIRYQRIIEVIQSDLAQHYLAFRALFSQDFEEFLLKFQSEQPMIHSLYSSMEKLSFCSMQKFVAKKYLFQANISAKSFSEIVKLDVYNKNHQKSLRLIEIGKKANVLFSRNLVRDEKQDLFRKE